MVAPCARRRKSSVTMGPRARVQGESAVAAAVVAKRGRCPCARTGIHVVERQPPCCFQVLEQSADLFLAAPRTPPLDWHGQPVEQHHAREEERLGGDESEE